MHLASLGSWRIFGTQVFQALSEFRQLASGPVKGQVAVGEI